jgi:hypothetical protein
VGPRKGKDGLLEAADVIADCGSDLQLEFGIKIRSLRLRTEPPQDFDLVVPQMGIMFHRPAQITPPELVPPFLKSS